MSERTTSVTRRRALRVGALACVVGVAGCSSGGDENGGGSDGEREASSDDDGSGGSTDYADWLADAPNYDGSAVDRTGQDSVTVTVGAGNGLLFDPVAVEVSPGTTVVWEWTGRGGQHNVVEADGAFESELASAQGTTYERTFDEPGAVRYYCLPHQAVGMKGVVDVVED
ncbi:halocyanin domain-containing protein [Salinigranum halophilum]|uniref:halocyanin domain-containing protein n=1 Tax=Salinigranum halophilum TaxID=2565931 RepID=UPI0010A91A93|nr:halocyanin domain-containing protein [Salinigranum halophilum]